MSLSSADFSLTHADQHLVRDDGYGCLCALLQFFHFRSAALASRFARIISCPIRLRTKTMPTRISVAFVLRSPLFDGVVTAT